MAIERTKAFTCALAMLIFATFIGTSMENPTDADDDLNVDDEYFNSIANGQWEQAREDCLEIGRTLTEISDFAEFELIRKKYAKRFDVAQGYWLNARYVPSQQGFKWMESDVLVGDWIEQKGLWAEDYPGTPDATTGLQLIKTAEGSLRFRTLLVNFNQRYLCEKTFDDIEPPCSCCKTEKYLM